MTVDTGRILEEETMRKSLAILLTMAAMAITACGGSTTSGGGDSPLSSSSGGSGADLSSIALKPDFSWHDSYLVGTHATFPCGSTCHTLALTAKASPSAGYAVTSDRKQICYQCHAANYDATSAINHTSYNMGTYCNSCHYSDSFKTHNRASHISYHQYITTTCETCHASRYPSSHSNGRTSGCASCHQYSAGSWGFTTGAHIYTSGCSSCHIGKKPSSHSKYNTDSCELCHSYPSWSGASFSHSGISSACSTCHNGHYSPYSCEGCHTQGISWSFRHNSVTPENCYACHPSGSGEDDEGGEDDDD